MNAEHIQHKYVWYVQNHWMSRKRLRATIHKNPLTASAVAVVAVTIVATITLERLNAFPFAVSRCFGLWRIARAHNTYSHMHADSMWVKRFAERERGMCDVFFKLWLCGVLYYTTLRTYVCEQTCIKCETPARLLSLSLLLFVSIVINNIIYLSVRIVSHSHTHTHTLFVRALGPFTMVEWRRERG